MRICPASVMLTCYALQDRRIELLQCSAGSTLGDDLEFRALANCAKTCRAAERDDAEANVDRIHHNSANTACCTLLAGCEH